MLMLTVISITIYDICFSLAAGRNAAQAPTFLKNDVAPNCKLQKNEDSILKRIKKMARLVLQFCVCYNLGPFFNSDRTVFFFLK